MSSCSWDSDDDPLAALQVENLALSGDDASLPETVASSFVVATIKPGGSGSCDRFDVELCLLGPSGQRVSERTVGLLGMNEAEALRVAHTMSELATLDIASEFLVTKDDPYRLLPSCSAVAKAIQICAKYGEAIMLPPGCKSSDELLCNYFDRVCEELQVQASDFQPLIETCEPIPNVLHISVRGSGSEVAQMEAQMILASMFMRMQEYYESPTEMFRRQPFSCDQIRSFHHDVNKDGFTYYTHWPGFNLPGWVFRDAANGALGELRAQETALLRCVACLAGTHRSLHVSTCLDTNDTAEREQNCVAFYVIGSSSDSDGDRHEGLFGMGTCRDHELAHGLFFTTPAYRAAVLDIVRNTLSPADRTNMEAKLLSMGYANLPDIIEDEMQAYSVDGTSLGVYSNEAATGRAQIRALFDKEIASQSQSLCCVGSKLADIYSAENAPLEQGLGDIDEMEVLGLGDIDEMEVLVNICVNLSDQDLVSLACVSKNFRNKILWSTADTAPRSVGEEATMRWEDALGENLLEVVEGWKEYWHDV